MESVELVGRGLHGGKRCSVRLSRVVGPVRFIDGTREVMIHQLTPIRLDRGVRLGFEDFEVELVEHLFAALAGLRVRRGVAIEVTGGEIPLLDGAALELAMAVRALEPRPMPATLWVREHAEMSEGDAKYTFRPGDDCQLHVHVDFEGVGPQHADYDGSERGFLDHIAPARTFGFQRDAATLSAAGLAQGVDPHAVLVLDDAGQAVPPSRPAAPCELARHKLLDLLGDLYFYGGPPRGVVHAVRPGHKNTHLVAQKALQMGILSRDPP